MKYKLTAKTKMWCGHELHRIEATEDFGGVKAGDLGGWIENEKNLSQKGDAWVFDNAKVFGNAWVYGNARVFDNAKVYGDARVFDNAKVSGNAVVYGNARMRGDAWVSDDARVCGDTRVYGNARVFDNAKVYGDARVSDDARVSGNAVVYGNARMHGDAWVSDDARVCGDTRVAFWYREDFELNSTAGAVFKNSWSSHRDFFYNSQTRMWSVGCFLGTSEELCRKAYADNEESGDRYSEYIKFVEMFRGGDHVDTEAIKKEVLENEASEDA